MKELTLWQSVSHLTMALVAPMLSVAKFKTEQPLTRLMVVKVTNTGYHHPCLSKILLALRLISDMLEQVTVHSMSRFVFQEHA